jgi:hypothetical protein
MPADGMRATGLPERSFGTSVSVAHHRAYPSLLIMRSGQFFVPVPLGGAGVPTAVHTLPA